MQTFNQSNGITYNNRYRIIFATWEKRNFITGEIKALTHNTLRQMGTEEGLTVLSITGGEDYVDMYVECDPRLNVHKAIKNIKKRSAGIIKQKYAYNYGGVWTTKYLLCTIGDLTEEDVAGYIGNPIDPALPSE